METLAFNYTKKSKATTLLMLQIN